MSQGPNITDEAVRAFIESLTACIKQTKGWLDAHKPKAQP